jgi:hypothetical protein
MTPRGATVVDEEDDAACPSYSQIEKVDEILTIHLHCSR